MKVVGDHYSHNADDSGGKKRVRITGQAKVLEDSRCVVAGGVNQ